MMADLKESQKPATPTPKPSQKPPAIKSPADKARTRVVTELHLKDVIVKSRIGVHTSILPDTDAGPKHNIKMVADLDARTIGIKVPGNGTTIIPFESAKSFKYGMGRPAVD